MDSNAPVTALSRDRRIAEALLEISYAVGSVMEMPEILQRICDTAARVMGTDTCSVYLRSDEERDLLVLGASQGLSMAEELGVRGFHMGDGLPGWAAAHDETVRVADEKQDPRWARLDDTSKEDPLHAYLCTPLRIQSDVAGVISFRRRRVHEWTDEEALFAEFIAKQVAIVLEKARLYVQKVEAERLAAIAVSLGEVAHYIRNVLQNMAGGAYFVDTGLRRGDLAKVERGWDLHKRSTEKIRMLVENMLAWTREKRSEPKEDDLNAVMAELADAFENTAFHRGVAFHITLDDNIPTIRFDRDALHDSVLNLLGNALDAIPAERKGEIELSTQLDLSTRSVRVRVRDNGVGIPEAARPKLFNLFFTTKGAKGTGIGLAVTRKIVEEHGGTIGYETELGVGTVFTISLPLG